MSRITPVVVVALAAAALSACSTAAKVGGALNPFDGGAKKAASTEPQDGRISLRVAGRAVDVRVSTIPAGHGERVVLRLLDKLTPPELGGCKGGF